MKAILTITVEIKGQSFELNQAEARQLRDALDAVVATKSPYAPNKSVAEMARDFEKNRDDFLRRQQMPPQQFWTPLNVTCGVAQ